MCSRSTCRPCASAGKTLTFVIVDRMYSKASAAVTAWHRTRCTRAQKPTPWHVTGRDSSVELENAVEMAVIHSRERRAVELPDFPDPGDGLIMAADPPRPFRHERFASLHEVIAPDVILVSRS